MTTCSNCHRTMAPRGESVTNHPGSVATGGFGMCSNCYNREHRAGRVSAPAPTAKPRYTGPCCRCGVPAPERRRELCIDCREVLSAAEAEVWAA